MLYKFNSLRKNAVQTHFFVRTCKTGRYKALLPIVIRKTC